MDVSKIEIFRYICLLKLGIDKKGKFMKTVRLTSAQALFRYLIAQKILINGKKEPLFPGAFGIYGHGNVACIGQTMEEFQDELPGYRGRSRRTFIPRHF